MAHHRVVVGLSGGVDSAVSAWLLKQAGHEVVGVFMKNWEDDDDGEYCSTRQDFIDAASVAEVLGIEIEAVNFAAEYRERVFSIFLREYAAGRTPNPDVLCNSEIKFNAFLDFAIQLGAEKLATGHYARVRQLDDGNVQLLRGLDPGKDQSYFLHRLNQQQLRPAMFPVGELHKSEVRRIAAEIKLPNATKKDSTGICFIGERPFREFLNRYLPTKPGPMVLPDGKRIGEHIGLSFYTIGQRKGLHVGGRKDSSGEPWFVVAKDLPSNTLVVAQGHDHPALLSHELSAEAMHWISGESEKIGRQLGAKTRYRQADGTCTLLQVSDATQQIRLHFDQAQWAVTPGQSVVLYDGEVCLGGGLIAAAESGRG